MDIVHPKYGKRTPWCIKAEIIKKLYKLLCTCYKTSIKKKVRTLLAFGGTDSFGLDIRPKLMCNAGTEIAIIGSIVAFHTCGTSGQPRANRIGAIDHILVYQRTGVSPVVIAPAVRQLADLVERIPKNPKYRLRRKQNPVHLR